jgi:hypothetical protein
MVILKFGIKTLVEILNYFYVLKILLWSCFIGSQNNDLSNVQKLSRLIMSAFQFVNSEINCFMLCVKITY